MTARKLILPVVIPLFLISLLLNLYFISNSGKGDQVTIHTVVDGDTVITEGGIRMRLANIEAPELENCGGKEAKKRLAKLTEGIAVKIVSSGEDVYNRTLVLVYTGDTLVNEVLLSEGLVRYEGSRSIVRDKLRVAYQKAVKEKLGIFGPSCRSEKPDNSKCVIKGNIRRSSHGGGKIYLFPGCSEYSRTIVEKDLGEQWFCSEKEAVAAGFIKASNCPNKFL